MKSRPPKVAYFSLEIALDNDIKTYAGGLGVLAGDILRGAADLGMPMVGVSLLSEQGYFDQVIDANGKQEDRPAQFYDFSKLKKLDQKIIIKIGLDDVYVGAWQYDIVGAQGYIVPVYLLDTNLPENAAVYRQLTAHLYGGDSEYRLLQTIILGRGGFEMLGALNYHPEKYHINESGSSLAALSYYLASSEKDAAAKLLDTRKSCVFTTHTAVQAAKNIFSLELLLKYQPDFPTDLLVLAGNDQLDFDMLALQLSGYANAVSKLNQTVVAAMFPQHQIDNITNGVHAPTWTAAEWQLLYDKYLPAWRLQNEALSGALVIPASEIGGAHQQAKKRLIDLVQAKTGLALDAKVFTIGFARRFTAYKRSALLFQDMERLLQINNQIGKMQIIYSGKAHPSDESGKETIAFIHELKEQYKDRLSLVFLDNYDLNIAKALVAGVDLWLNTPLPPNEASGTSGMKAAHNGVPQLSTADGWWPEGYVENKSGWLIAGDSLEKDAASLYENLERNILPLYYQRPQEWLELMRTTISLNAARFNIQRALKEYQQKAYLI